MRATKVTDVFAERNAINAGQRVLSGERVRILVRSLEAETDKDWIAHPLRNHALAEAYSLFGQSAASSSYTVALDSAHNGEGQFSRAIDLYNQVSNSANALAPKSLRISARVNMGNARYYMGDYQGALKAWRAATYGEDGQPNLGPWSNMIAALVMLDRPKDAVTEGEHARTWAESSGKAFTDTYQFAGVLGNMALAKLQLDDVSGAVADLATANAFRDDDLTEENLALALIIAKRFDDSQRILRKLSPPASLESPGDDKVARCVYLIWALSMPDAPRAMRAANFSAFLSERLSSEELKNLSRDQFTSLVQRVSAMLSKAQLPCSTLGKIKRVASLFDMQ